MNGLVNCNRCGHGVVSHGDARCEERRCDCPFSRRFALEAEIVRVRSKHADRPAASRRGAPGSLPATDSPFGSRIRELRIDRGWSQSRLAVTSGVERTTLQRIEAGLRRDPGFSIVVRLARAFEVSIDTFALLV